METTRKEIEAVAIEIMHLLATSSGGYSDHWAKITNYVWGSAFGDWEVTKSGRATRASFTITELQPREGETQPATMHVSHHMVADVIESLGGGLIPELNEIVDETIQHTVFGGIVHKPNNNKQGGK